MTTLRMTLCARLMLIPQSLKERLCIMSLTTSSTMTCHMQMMTMNYSDNPRIMSYTSNNFLDTDAMFLKFDDDLDNLARGSSSVGENTVGSSSQPPATPTPKRCAQSRLLKLERHIAGNGRIPMTITLGAKKPISPHAVFFNQAIGVCVRKRFPVHCLKWADVGREYIEVVKNDLQFFVLDFNDQAMNSDLEEARANPPAYWLDIIRIDTSSATTT
ncbi:CACTA en-spm transposon protein [Cucumis melo var. makuwa]|uniref:CACTA en-spm transposon protein n=1 Tax=Cucumis melo var. makuwa TaxID=1194695 RepID=A0A5D3BQ64_CUCMM|nr:CACTA en-spm transposon protein [Cucumis melo var. makuwa]